MNLNAVAILSFAAVAAAQDPDHAIGARVRKAVQAVDPAQLEETVRTLVGFGTRHVLSRTDSEAEGTGAARSWLRSRYEALVERSGGRLQVAATAARVPVARAGMPDEVEVVNIVATLPGVGDPDRIYVVGGHYDSRNNNGADGTRSAPGANDDASGTAVALAACRALCDQQFAATIVFCAYDGEEQGLLGSKAHADTLAAAAAKVDGMIGCDIVGNSLGMDGKRYDGWVRCFSYSPTGNDSVGRSLARAVTYAARTHVPDFAAKLVFRGDRYGRGGDHHSFFAQGFPAVRMTEPREDYSRQHQDVTTRDGAPYGDLPEFVDFGYAANVARVVVATLAELAAAPPPPRALRAQGATASYDTLLDYELPDRFAGADVEFVWRETTAADWQGVVPAAQVEVRAGDSGRRRALLRGLCLDDLVVGVRSVGADGARSRAVTPPEPERSTMRAGAREGGR